MSKVRTLQVFAAILTAFVIYRMAPLQAQDHSAFRTPSGNIACAVFDRFLRCDLRENSAKVPPQPKDCELDWGNYFGMGLKGKAQRLCVGDTVFGNYPLLAYGKTWNYQGFSCTSSLNGLTCRNRDKKGFFLNKLQQKLF